MTEKPILFSTPMVQAILKGRKTMTRRVIKGWSGKDWTHHPKRGSPWPAKCVNGLTAVVECPYAVDQLWVRETWSPWADEETKRMMRSKDNAVYRADYRDDSMASFVGGIKWKPSIFMPRCASRITLAVREIRVERLQDITEEDAKAEGAEKDENYYRGFWNLWDSINGKKYPWASNPWVWVVRFERIKQ